MSTASAMLDVGCGTGRFSRLIAQHVHSQVIGVDPSSGMLYKARSLSTRQISWAAGKAERLPFRDSSFDALFCSYVLHHVDDRQLTLREMFRVLREHGRCGIRYSSHAQLAKMLVYRFFPMALQYDLERAPDAREMRELLSATGFTVIDELPLREQTVDSSEDYLHKIRHKFSSALSLISDGEFESGLEAATLYLTAHRLEEEEKHTETTFLVGIKP